MPLRTCGVRRPCLRRRRFPPIRLRARPIRLRGSHFVRRSAQGDTVERRSARHIPPVILKRTATKNDRKEHAPCDRVSRCGDRLLPRLPKNIQKPPQNGCIFRQIWYNNKAKAVAAALFKSAPVSAFELCEDIKTLLWLRCSSCIRCGSDLAISKLNMLLWLSCSSCIRCGSDLAISKLNMLLWLSCSGCIRCGSDLAISKLNMLLWLSR